MRLSLPRRLERVPSRWTTPRAAFGTYACSTVPGTWAASDEEVANIPEFAQGQEQFRNKKYRAAISSFERAYDICSTYVGKSGGLTQSTLRQLVNVSDVFGELKVADSAFSRLQEAVAEDPLDDSSFFVSQAHCRYLLHQGDAATAKGFADRSFEAATAIGDPTRLISALELQGVCDMVLGLSERSLTYFDQGVDLCVNPATGDAPATATQHDVAVSSLLRNRGAYSYLVDKDLDCALTFWERGFGGSSSELVAPDATTKYLESLADLDSLSVESRFLELNQCGNLNNVAMVHVKKGEMDNATNILGVSMKKLDRFVEFRTPQEETLHAITMGRSLRLLAQVFHANEQAITSEGLYRSSMQRYEGIKSLDAKPMIQYQLANTQQGYTRLLAEWDKRESESAQMEDSAEALYNNVENKFSKLEHTISSIFSLPGWSV